MNQAGKIVSSTIKNRLITGCLSLMIAVPVLGCFFGLLFFVVFPTIDQMIANGQGENFPIFLAVFGILLLFGMILVPALAVTFVIQRRARMLDSIFVPLGLEGKMYLLVGRHYWGEIAGRPVEIYFYRGPTLDIRVGAYSGTKLQILPKTTIPVKIGQSFQKAPLAFSDPGMEKFAVYAEDEVWAKQFLADFRLIPLIDSLLYGHTDWAIFRHLEISPDQVTLLFYRSKNFLVAKEQFSAVQTWLQDLAGLAERIESLPKPALILSPNPIMSRESRLKRSQIQFIIILALIIGLPICFLGIGLLTFLLVSL